MSYADQVRAKQNAVNTAANARQTQRQGTGDDARTPTTPTRTVDALRSRGAGASGTTGSARPAWMDAYANRWGSGAVGGTGTAAESKLNLFGGPQLMVPDFNTPANITRGQATPRPAWASNVISNTPSWAQPGQAGTPSQSGPMSTPAWLGTAMASRNNSNMGAQLANPYAYTVGNDGNIRNNQGAPAVPTGSFLAAGGQAALNGDQTASWLNLPQYPTGTFFAGGGSMVAGPGQGYLPPPNQDGGGSGGGFSYGGGGGFGSGWGGRRSGYGQQPWLPDMGLFQLNWKG